jgi:hypothetical protein
VALPTTSRSLDYAAKRGSARDDRVVVIENSVVLEKKESDE